VGGIECTDCPCTFANNASRVSHYRMMHGPNSMASNVIEIGRKNGHHHQPSGSSNIVESVDDAVDMPNDADAAASSWLENGLNLYSSDPVVDGEEEEEANSTFSTTANTSSNETKEVEECEKCGRKFADLAKHNRVR
jgi:hypothetical protein